MPNYYIGVDWGKSKCGIALADDENKIATPYKSVTSTDFFNELEKINADNPVKKIIIGALKKGENIRWVEEFVDEIRFRGFEAEAENEDFSSVMAQANLKETGAKNISTIDDAEAARIILQSWLDRKVQ